MTDVKTYRDLIAWQKGMDLAVAVYQWTDAMPSREQFGLTQQIRRAVVSVPSNIAEGYARGTSPDYLRFLRIARGSMAEAETQAELIRRLDLCAVSDSVRGQFSEADRVLHGLIRSIERKV